MTMTSGFFDSIDHDRQYTAMQFGQIMDYLINDGVYWRYPESGVVFKENGEVNDLIPPFQVTVNNDRDGYYNPNQPAVVIGPGRAWFDHTWTWVITPEILELPPQNDATNRWDAIVLTMNKSVPMRQNYFRVIQGLAGRGPNSPHSATPDTILAQSFNVAPSMLQGHYMHNDEVHDVPIAFVYRQAGATEVSPSDIVNAVGDTSLCPYVKSVVNEEGTDVFSMGELYQRWSKDWDAFLRTTQEEYDVWHSMFGNASNEQSQEWQGFLDERSADFMRFIKMLDRIWHVWYQGSVNWVYEYIRKLDTHEEEFFSKWTCVINDAQSMLEQGLSPYLEKINEILVRFDDIDNLVAKNIYDFKVEVWKEVQKFKDGLSADAQNMVNEAIEDRWPDIIQSVVDNTQDDIFAQIESNLNSYIEKQIQAHLADDFTEMREDLQRTKDALVVKFQQKLAEISEMYAHAFDMVKQEVADYVVNVIQTDDTVKDAVTEVVETVVNKVMAEFIEDRSDEIVQQFKDEFTERMQEIIAEEVQKQLTGVYKLKGSVEFADLPTPSAELEGGVYNVTDAFTTDERFAEGEGVECPEGTNIVIVEKDGEWIFDVLAGSFDVSGTVSQEELDALKERVKDVEAKTEDLDLVTNLIRRLTTLEQTVTELRTQLNQNYLEKG